MKCLNCGMIGHHKTGEYKKCEKVKWTLMKILEYLIMRYGKEINMKQVRMDHKYGINIKFHKCLKKK